MQIEAKERELSQQYQILTMERQQLQRELERVRMERERTEEERRKIAAAQNELEFKAQEVENASRKAEQLHVRSQQALQETHHRQIELTKQTAEINRLQEQLKEKEMSLAKVSFMAACDNFYYLANSQ